MKKPHIRIVEPIDRNCRTQSLEGAACTFYQEAKAHDVTKGIFIGSNDGGDIVWSMHGVTMFEVVGILELAKREIMHDCKE